MHVHHYVTLLLLASALAVAAQDTEEEEFSEELLLRPLPDGNVLAHFHFAHQLPPTIQYGHHHVLFPKAIFQLVQKFRIQEMELSFTQGRWNYNKWGGVDPLTRLHAKPAGVELWATFAVPDDQTDATWGNLTHALSGLFCASLNFLESTVMVAKPAHTFFSDYGMERKTSAVSLDESVKQETKGERKLKAGEFLRQGRVRYGALPREAVCTENLTPWLKLLPCRDKAGLAALLDRPTIYKGLYHSLRLYIRCYDFEEHRGVGNQKGTLLQQTLTLVIAPSETPIPGDVKQRLQPSWSLSSLFGRHLTGRCLLAKSSAIFLEFEAPLVEKLEQSGIGIKRRNFCVLDGKSSSNEFDLLDCSADVIKDTGPLSLSILKENDIFKVTGTPSSLSLEGAASGNGVLVTFAIPKHGRHHSLNVGLTWKVPMTWSPVRGPFRATRFLVGSGNARGAIALVLKSNHSPTGHLMGLQWKKSSESESLTRADMITVTLFQVVPWYIRLYFHTLQVLIDEQPKSFWEVVRWMQVVPSEDRKSPGVMEMELIIPYNASVITIITEFDKGFLRIDEHPPDANRGFDLPSALLGFPSERSERHYYHLGTVKGSGPAPVSALLQELQKTKAVQVYTEVLLVPLATPDFSMPYNVITLTCTVLALYFGSLLNVLRRRIGEEERLASMAGDPAPSKLERLLSRLLGRFGVTSTAKIAKVLKVVLVVAIGATLNHYVSNS
ncbi:hypothetical protein GOP47_0015642 [Adiantum capillus-veneris]|uniref:GPI transamidase component PIG-T n=1 Tax=Adiantum capillus-veneris TaxID=13818 RepID=A0A9D4ZE58_ADICA|nr:hypothetical protein GOP47_0015642 [Adiantum capillus-veneris]